MDIEEVIINIIITPIIFVLCLFLSSFIALVDLIKFPIEMVVEFWR